MKVWNRINARKIVLSYFYRRSFFHNLPKQDRVISEVLSVGNIFQSNIDEFEKNKIILKDKLDKCLDVPWDENLDYFVNVFFDQWNIDEIDIDYVMAVWRSYEKYYQEAIDEINKYTESFSFQEMNNMNQALFILWYVERKVLETPKEILLNELVELAKRYDDEWSPKLINWIMHKIFNNIE